MGSKWENRKKNFNPFSPSPAVVVQFLVLSLSSGVSFANYLCLVRCHKFVSRHKIYIWQRFINFLVFCHFKRGLASSRLWVSDEDVACFYVIYYFMSRIMQHKIMWMIKNFHFLAFLLDNSLILPTLLHWEQLQSTSNKNLRSTFTSTTFVISDKQHVYQKPHHKHLWSHKLLGICW